MDSPVSSSSPAAVLPEEPARPRLSSGRFAFLGRPGAWLVALLLLGAGARAWLVFATQGTNDVRIWTEHAAGVAARGLIDHYRSDPNFNHPPAIGLAMAWLWKLSEATGIPFRVLYRAPIAALDFASSFLLLRILTGRPERWLVLGAYSIAPVALILSAQHGNTDACVGFCLLAATLLAAQDRPLALGLVVGLGLWIKLPVVLGVPALGFALRRWRDRVVFALTAMVLAAACYGPSLLAAPEVVAQRIFGYQGVHMFTRGGSSLWGVQNFLFRAFGRTVELWPDWVRILYEHDRWIALGSMIAFAWLRRRSNDAPGLAATMAGCFALFYGMSNAWAFQYFGWSMAFWMTAGPGFALLSNVLAGGYIYALYVLACGDALLRGHWTFNRVPVLPEWLGVLRDANVLLFLGFGLARFARALVAELRSRRAVAVALPVAGPTDAGEGGLPC